jgi:tetratricopeptide (TPR) repeat protein
MARNKRLTKEEIQEDKFIEGLLKAYAFLKGNLQTIIVAAVVVLVAVAGYAAYYQHQGNRRAEATLALRQATEAYQKAEESLFDAEKLAESEELLTTAQTELKAVFEKYANTTFADKARYQYANTFYYQGNYPEARTQFQQLIEKHQPENQMDSLYAQKAIGNTYEQEGDYEKAVAAYQAKVFPPTPQLSPEIRKFVLMEAKFNQALAYEKFGDLDAARNTYQEIVDEFRSTLETGLAQKSRELIEEAKVVIAAIDEPLDVSNARKLEDEKQYFEAYAAYTDVIRTYKVNRDIQGGLPSELRKQIGGFEKGAMTVINSIQNARRAEDDERESSALYGYDLVVELETLGLSRRLYENALFHYKRLGSAQ